MSHLVMHSDRRRTARRAPSADEPLARVRLRAGSQLHVVDISNTGLLAEGEARLLLGTHVDVHIITADGRLLVRSRIARACVVHVDPACVRYRGALTFERAIDTSPAGYAIPSILSIPDSPGGIVYPEAGADRMHDQGTHA